MKSVILFIQFILISSTSLATNWEGARILFDCIEDSSEQPFTVGIFEIPAEAVTFAEVKCELCADFEPRYYDLDVFSDLGVIQYFSKENDDLYFFVMDNTKKSQNVYSATLALKDIPSLVQMSCQL